MTKLINYTFLIIRKYNGINEMANKVLIDPGEVIYTLFNLQPIILSYPSPPEFYPMNVSIGS